MIDSDQSATMFIDSHPHQVTVFIDPLTAIYQNPPYLFTPLRDLVRYSCHTCEHSALQHHNPVGHITYCINRGRITFDYTHDLTNPNINIVVRLKP